MSPVEENRSSNSASFSSSIGINIYDIPTDAINEILFLIDPKTLCRLRCVSRWWNAHITSLTFCFLHYRRSWPLQIYWKPLRCPFRGLLYVFYSTSLAHPRNSNPCSFDHKIMAEVSESSCCGLIFLHSNRRMACIYNPITRSSVVNLPPYNDSCWYPKLALGLAHSTNQFKVLCLSSRKNYNTGHRFPDYDDCKVLTIPEDLDRGWRVAPSPPSGDILKTIIVSSESSIYALSRDLRRLFLFDLEFEEWSEVKLPPSAESFDKIVDFGGKLCLVVEKTELHSEFCLLRDCNLWVKELMPNESPCKLPLTQLQHDTNHGRMLMINYFGLLKCYWVEEGTHEEMDYWYVESIKYFDKIKFCNKSKL